jgi:hypothetical protein
MPINVLFEEELVTFLKPRFLPRIVFFCLSLHNQNQILLYLSGQATRGSRPPVDYKMRYQNVADLHSETLMDFLSVG